MPILVKVPEVVMPVTEEEVAMIVAKAVAQAKAEFLAMQLPGMVDKNKNPLTVKGGFQQAHFAYNAITEGGAADLRSDRMEAEAKANAERDATEAAEQDRIQEALRKPILPE